MFTVGFTKTGHKSRRERDWCALKQMAEDCLLPLPSVQTIDESIEKYHYELIENTFGRGCYKLIISTSIGLTYIMCFFVKCLVHLI